MGDRYAATGRDGACTGTPGDTSLNIFNSGTTTRGRLYDAVFSQDGTTPADETVTWIAQRTTAVGTEASGVVPAPLDAAAPAAQFDGGQGHTVEPTATAATEFVDYNLNMRATFRWVAAPGGEIVLPATANAGANAVAFSTNYDEGTLASLHWEE